MAFYLDPVKYLYHNVGYTVQKSKLGREFPYLEFSVFLVEWLQQFEDFCHHFVPLSVFQVVDTADEERHKIVLCVCVCVCVTSGERRSGR